MIFQNAQTLQSLNDPILLQDSTSVFLNTDAKISQSIVRYLNILTGNTKNDNFVEIPYTFYKGNELDFFFGFLTNFQGKAFIVMPDLASIEPVIQALDLLNRLCNLHIFHNSQLTCNQVLNDIISERNKNIFNIAISGTQAHLGKSDYNSWQKFDSYRLGNIYRDPEALIEPLKMTDLTIFDLSVVKQSDLPARKLISVSGLGSETSNQIAATVGASNGNRLFIITGLDQLSDASELDADMFSQLFYYWNQGRSNPNFGINYGDDESNFLVDDVGGFEHINFYKNKISSDWSVEYPLSLSEKYQKFKRIPCTYFDYEFTAAGDLSPRLYEIFMALNQYHEIVFPD